MSGQEHDAASSGRGVRELQRAVDGLTDDEMRRVWLGTWGVREILIHVSGWHEAMVPALGHIAKGDAPYPAGTL